MSLLNSVLKVFVGDKSKQDVKAIMPVVNKIKTFEAATAALSNDALRAKTTELKARITAHLSSIDQTIQEEQAKAEALPMSEFMGRDTIYQNIDELKIQIKKDLI